MRRRTGRCSAPLLSYFAVGTGAFRLGNGSFIGHSARLASRGRRRRVVDRGRGPRLAGGERCRVHADPAPPRCCGVHPRPSEPRNHDSRCTIPRRGRRSCGRRTHDHEHPQPRCTGPASGTPRREGTGRLLPADTERRRVNRRTVCRPYEPESDHPRRPGGHRQRGSPRHPSPCADVERCQRNLRSPQDRAAHDRCCRPDP